MHDRVRPTLGPFLHEEMMDLVRRDDVSKGSDRVDPSRQIRRQRDRRPDPNAPIRELDHGHSCRIGEAHERHGRAIRDVKRWSEFLEHQRQSTVPFRERRSSASQSVKRDPNRGLIGLSRLIGGTGYEASLSTRDVSPFLDSNSKGVYCVLSVRCRVHLGHDRERS